MLSIRRGLQAGPQIWRCGARRFAATVTAPPKSASARLEFLNKLERDGAKTLKVIGKRVDQRARLLQVCLTFSFCCAPADSSCIASRFVQRRQGTGPAREALEGTRTRPGCLGRLEPR